jgi:copper transport protein
MLAAGAVLAFIELPDISHLLSSHYGQILVVKIGLVSGLCLLASYNRFWLTTPAAEGDRSARFRLRRSIACEVVVAAAIVGAASLWRFASPIPPAIKQPSLSVHLHSANVMAQFELSQGSADKATARVFVMRPDFGPFEPRSVDLRLLNPEAGVEPIKYPLQKSPDGGWEAAVLPIANPKGWKVDVAVLIDDFVSAHLEGNLMPQ